jgi:hypothetical protein
MTIVGVNVNDDVWQSILNRSREVKTNIAFEFVCMKYLVEIYPKEKETSMRSIINNSKYIELKKQFELILKEVKEFKGVK